MNNVDEAKKHKLVGEKIASFPRAQYRHQRKTREMLQKLEVELVDRIVSVVFVLLLLLLV